MSVPVYVQNKKQPIHAIGVNKFISREILIKGHIASLLQKVYNQNIC